MAKNGRDVPPPLELLCLKALWTLGQGNVREVQRLVSESRPLAYTTIMTVLDRLVRKGKLARSKSGRAFVYAPQQSRDATRRAALRMVVDEFFDGSQENLIQFLRSSDGASTAAPAENYEDSRIDTILL
jgi:predicted transcriptional regulator